MRSRGITVRGGILLLAVLAVSTAMPTVAQLASSAPAVPVRNADERGRVPYVETRALFCQGGGALICETPFPSVPAGYRLVLEGVNASINSSVSGVRRAALVAPGGVLFVLPTSPPSASEPVIVHEAVLAYYEGGQAPDFQVVVNDGRDTPFVTATVSGYLARLTLFTDGFESGDLTRWSASN